MVTKWQKDAADFKKHCAQAMASYKKACKFPDETQKKLIMDIVNITSGTEFGEAHHTSRITDIHTFKTHIPIRDYHQYKPWINKEIDQQGGVLSNRKLVRWLKTSGTTDEPKKIPCTSYWLEEYRAKANAIMWCSYLNKAPELLAHPFAILDTQTVRQEIKQTVNGIPYQAITNRNPPISYLDWIPPWYDAPWIISMPSEKYEDRIYRILRYFIEQDLRVITAINPSTLIALHHYLILFLPKLIEELKKGSLWSIKKFKPNIKLATKLKYFKKNTPLTTLWPNLTLITCWTAASAIYYKPQLDLLFPNVSILPFMNCGTEGVVTLPIDSKNQPGVLAITQGIYEFIPKSVDLASHIARGNQVDTLSFSQLEVNKEYHLIMSQMNGLYRFATGDIYKVINYVDKVPRLDFVHRDGIYFSFTGEKITRWQMMDAIQKTIAHYGSSLGLFMCFPIFESVPYYKILIETSINNDILLYEIAEKIDTILMKINEEYLGKRNSNRLEKIKIQFMQPGTIHSYLQEKKRTSENPLQLKYDPLQTDIQEYKKLLFAVVDIHKKPV